MNSTVLILALILSASIVQACVSNNGFTYSVVKNTLFKTSLSDLSLTSSVTFNLTVKCTGIVSQDGMHSILVTHSRMAPRKRSIIIVDLDTLKFVTVNTPTEPLFLQNGRLVTIERDQLLGQTIIRSFSIDSNFEKVETLITPLPLSFIRVVNDTAMFTSPSGQIGFMKMSEMSMTMVDNEYISELTKCESHGHSLLFCKTHNALITFSVEKNMVKKINTMPLPALPSDILFKVDAHTPNTIHWVTLPYEGSMMRYLRINTQTMTWTHENEMRDSDSSIEELKVQINISAINNKIIYTHMEYPKGISITVYDTETGEAMTRQLN